MTLPPDIQFYEEFGLLIYRPRGVLNEASINKIVSVVDELEAELHAPFNRCLDTLEQDEVEWNYKYIIEISLYRRQSYGNRPAIKSAILATHSTIVHYARLHAILTQSSPIQVHVFGQRKEAAQWLEVPLQLLMPKG